MNPALIVLLIFLGLMGIAWLVEKFAKPTVSDPRKQQTNQKATQQKSRTRRKRTIVYQQEENEFPDYDPTHNDEVEWRSLVEQKFRKRLGYPPDWERRRVLVFLRDRGRCQSKEHRGGTCGRLLCEPNHAGVGLQSINLAHFC